jgi:hypothetical protein
LYGNSHQTIKNPCKIQQYQTIEIANYSTGRFAAFYNENKTRKKPRHAIALSDGMTCSPNPAKTKQ